jgi:hypothetical protein
VWQCDSVALFQREEKATRPKAGVLCVQYMSTLENTNCVLQQVSDALSGSMLS